MSEIISRINVPVFNRQIELGIEAIRDGHLSIGPHLAQLEQSLCGLFQKRYAVLTVNGFSALFLALKVLAPPDSQVLTTPISTCFAMVNAIRAAGHVPVFVDVDMASASLDLPVEPFRVAGALIPDHFGIIAPACRKWTSCDKFLIEDSAQAFLSRTNNQTTADVVVVSLYPTKIANGIDGGALLTDDEALYKRAKRLASYVDQYEYETAPRFNVRMPNIHAAFALATLEQLAGIRHRLETIYGLFSHALQRNNIAHLTPGLGEVLWKLLIVAPDRKVKDEWTLRLKAAGLQVYNELISVCDPKEFIRYPHANAMVERTFSVPFHVGLSEDDVVVICQALEEL